jgi:hypothetical protein
MRQATRDAIYSREVCDRLDAFAQRISGCIEPEDDRSNVVVMHVAEQVEPAADFADGVMSLPIIGGLIAKFFG